MIEVDEGFNQVFAFFVCLILYGIAFVQLFQRGSSEYIAYVFVFIVNAIFPFVWIHDFRNFIKNSQFKEPVKTLLLYREFGVYIALVVQFVSMLLVLLKNENVRKFNLVNDKSHTLQTSDKSTETNDSIILSLMVSIVTIVWALIGHTFSDSPVLQEAATSSVSTPLVDTLKWLQNQPYNMFRFIHTGWRRRIDKVNATPLFKACAIYLAAFVTFFLGVFIRPRTFKNQENHKSIDYIDIINMSPTFSSSFDQNLNSYRLLTAFFMSILSIGGFASVSNLVGSMVGLGSFPIKLCIFAGSIFIFGIIFGTCDKTMSSAMAIKRNIFFLLSIVFSILGTPVVLSFLQFLYEIGFMTWLHGGAGVFAMVSFIIGLSLTVFMYVFGLSSNWLENNNSKEFLLFNVILVCMLLSLFLSISLATKDLFLYTFIKSIVENVLLYLAPCAIVVLSLIQLYYASVNFKKFNKIHTTVKKT